MLPLNLGRVSSGFTLYGQLWPHSQATQSTLHGLGTWLDELIQCTCCLQNALLPQTCKCLDTYDVTSSNDLGLAGKGGQWKALDWSYRWLMHFCPLCLSHAVKQEGGRSAQDMQLARLVSVDWFSSVPQALASYTPLTPSHILSHTHTHFYHTTHPLTHPHGHPNKHASHTRQMCWWWICPRRKESHSPSCLEVQRGRVLETSISNKYVWQHTSAHKSALWV